MHDYVTVIEKIGDIFMADLSEKNQNICIV